MLAVYAIVKGNDVGWATARTIGLLTAAAVLLAIFVAIEARVSSPLVPLRLFKLRNVATANVVGILWAAAMFAWFFLSALYLQLVLGYSPLQVGLAFLPSNLIMGVVLARPLREARDALRSEAASCCRALAGRARPRALRTRSGRRATSSPTCSRA